MNDAASALSQALARRGHHVDHVEVAPHWRWRDLICCIYAVDGTPSCADHCDAFVLVDPDLLDAWLEGRGAVADDAAPGVLSALVEIRAV